MHNVKVFHFLLWILFYFSFSNETLAAKSTQSHIDSLVNAAYMNMDSGKYAVSALLYEKAFELGKSKSAEEYFNIACAWSMAGNPDKAFQSMDSALVHGFINNRRLANAEELNLLRKDARWNLFLSKYYSHWNTRATTYFWGMYLGILFVFFCYNLFLYFSIRDTAYLYYSLSIFFLAHLHTIIKAHFGYFSQELLFWLKHIDLTFHISLFMTCLVVIFHLLFMKSFLMLKTNAPKFNTLFNRMLLFLGVYSIVVLYSGNFSALFFSSIFIIYIIAFVVGIVCWKRGFKPAKYLVLASIFLTLGVSIALISRIANLDIHFSFFHGVFQIDNIGFISFYAFLSFALGDKVNVLKQEKLDAQEKALALLEQKVKERTMEVVQQKELVEAQNRDILDSIEYAKRLQNAILPADKLVKEYLVDSFIFYKPKDIVAGDFYWFYPTKNNLNQTIILFAAADCTGHGVPGAMVSVVCANALNKSVKELGLREPGKILDAVSEFVIETFVQSSERNEDDVQDGMDISLCALNLTTLELQWSGANNPLIIIKNESPSPSEKAVGRLEELIPDKQPIGLYAERKPFTTHTKMLQKDSMLYLFSDGYADQFGGSDGKKLMKKFLKNHLLSIADIPIERQRFEIENYFDNWKGTNAQVDDVCVIGVRI